IDSRIRYGKRLNKKITKYFDFFFLRNILKIPGLELKFINNTLVRTRVYTKVKLYNIARSFIFLKRQEKIRLNKLNKIKRILRRFFHIYKGVRNSKIIIKSNEKKNGRNTSKAESSLVLKKKI